MALRSLPLPHALYQSIYLEVIEVQYYNHHDGVIHACVISLCFIKLNPLTPLGVYTQLPPPCIYPRLLSCISFMYMYSLLLRSMFKV